MYNGQPSFHLIRNITIDRMLTFRLSIQRSIIMISDQDKDKKGGNGSSETDQKGQILTTRQGHLVYDNQNLWTIGERGPATLENYQFMEKISHFAHSLIPIHSGIVLERITCNFRSTRRQGTGNQSTRRTDGLSPGYPSWN